MKRKRKRLFAVSDLAAGTATILANNVGHAMALYRRQVGEIPLPNHPVFPWRRRSKTGAPHRGSDFEGTFTGYIVGLAQ